MNKCTAYTLVLDIVVAKSLRHCIAGCISIFFITDNQSVATTSSLTSNDSNSGVIAAVLVILLLLIVIAVVVIVIAIIVIKNRWKSKTISMRGTSGHPANIPNPSVLCKFAVIHMTLDENLLEFPCR